MGKQKIIIVFVVLFVTVSGFFYSLSYEKEKETVFVVEEIATDDTKKTEEQTETPENVSEPFEKKVEYIYVHICGEVYAPDVYSLPKESRITDLVELAGGFTDAAAKDYVNLAQKLSDGQKIYIPALDEVQKNSMPETGYNIEGLGMSTGKVNLNTADKGMLMTLTGIGESKAMAIIEYRETKGGFDSIEELKEIEGIKDGVFNKIKDEIEI